MKRDPYILAGAACIVFSMMVVVWLLSGFFLP